MSEEQREPDFFDRPWFPPVARLAGIIIPTAVEALGAVVSVVALPFLLSPLDAASVLAWSVPAYLAGRAVRLLGVIAARG